MFEIGRQLAHRLFSDRVNAESQFSGKAGYPQQAHRIFTESGGRVAHYADNTVVNILETISEIMDAVVARVVVQGIDSQITAAGIIADGAKYIIPGEHTGISLLASAATFFIRAFAFVGTEGRDLNQLAAKLHMHNLKATTDNS